MEKNQFYMPNTIFTFLNLDSDYSEHFINLRTRHDCRKDLSNAPKLRPVLSRKPRLTSKEDFSSPDTFFSFKHKIISDSPSKTLSDSEPPLAKL